MLRKIMLVIAMAISVCRAADDGIAEAKLEVRRVEVLPIIARGARGQVIALAGGYRGAPQRAQIMLDGAKVAECELAEGGIYQQISVPLVAAETKSALTIEAPGGAVLARAEIVRRPVRELTIYIVPHSHVDVGYTQLQPEIETKQVNNLLSAMEMIAQTQNNPPGSQYRWTLESSWTIDNLLRDRPDKVGALEAAVKAKQVELDGAFGNLLTGLCRPEELIRSYAWGGRYGRQFGVPVKAAMISDVPGYTWGTISALSAAGIKYFSIGPNFLDRIGTTLVAWEDKPFYWQGPDGKQKVLCWVSYKGYAWSHIIKKVTEGSIATYIEHLEQMKYPYDLTYIRWSGHGDNAVPDPGLIESVKTFNESYDWPKLKIALVSEPFEALEKRYADKIPIVRGDWTPYWEDGAGSSALETAMNRATTERLVAAETLWALLRPGEKFPTDEFRQAWRGAMLYSEHTWGAHCSVTEPQDPLTTGQWKYKRGYAHDADERSRKLLDASLGGGTAVANAVDVFNVTSWPRSEVVIVPKELSSEGDRVGDLHGRAVTSQRMSSGELAFLASDVPAMSSRRFVISKGEASRDGDAKGGELIIENSRLRVRLDPATGNVAQLIRVGDGMDFVKSDSAGLNEYLYVEAAQFDQPKKVPPSPKITLVDSGPLVAVLRVESAAPGCRNLSRDVRLVSGADYIELIDRLDKLPAQVKPVSAGGNPQDPNNGKEAVHFAFPFNVPNGQIRMDTPLAVIQPERDQMPGACKNWFTVQRFVDVSNETNGVTIAPLDTPLVQVGGITATLIGSQTNPDVWLKKVDPQTQSLYFWAMNNYWHTNYRAYQEGPTTFRYAIRPHEAYSPDQAQRFGIERSQPLVFAAAQDRAPADTPRPIVDSPDVIVSAFKPADDGTGYVLRLFAAGGKDADVKLRWSGRAPAAVYHSDSLESRVGKADDEIHLPAWGVMTFRIDVK